MKKTDRSSDELRPEYDFASMKGGVRGKYARRVREALQPASRAQRKAKSSKRARAVRGFGVTRHGFDGAVCGGSSKASVRRPPA